MGLEQWGKSKRVSKIRICQRDVPMCIVPLVVFTQVARKIACLHADLASTAITRETRKACFS